MVKNKSYNITKTAKEVAAGFAIALLLILITVLVLINPISERLLKYFVSNGSKGLYSLSIERTRVNPLAGNILLTEVRLHPEKNVYQQQAAQGEAPVNIFDVSVHQLELKNLGWLKLLFNGKADMDEIAIIEPELVWMYDQLAASQDKGNGMSNFLKQVNVQRFRIEKGYLKVNQKTKHIHKNHEVQNISIELKEVRANLEESNSIRESIIAENFHVALENYTGHFADSIYTIYIGGLSYSDKEGKLIAEAIEINSDISNNKQLATTNPDSAYKYLYNISLPRMELNKTHLLKAWSQKELLFGTLLFEKLQIKVTTFTQVPPADSAMDYKNLYKYFKKFLNSISADELRIRDAQFTLAQHDQESEIKQFVKSFSFQADGIRIDSTIPAQPLKIYYARDVFLKAKEVSADLPNGLYALKLDNFTACSKQEVIAADSLRIIPQYSKAAFVHKLPYRTDRIHLRNKHIAINGIRIGDLIKNQEFIADTISIEKTMVNIFRDMTPPLRNQEKPLPHQALHQLPLTLIIKTVRISDVDIKYEELRKGSNQPGLITLDDLYATIHNITNSEAVLRQQNKMEAQAQAQLMGKSTIQASLSFPLDNKSGRYTFRGSMDKFNVENFNKLVIPLAQVKIESGIINKATFEMVSDNDHANGTIDVYYENLDLKLLNDQRESNFTQKAGSFFINNLILKSSNPSNGNFRKGTIDTKREKRKSIFNHWSQSFIDGLVSAMTTEPAETIIEEVGE
jgi:hypothetical protein